MTGSDTTPSTSRSSTSGRHTMPFGVGRTYARRSGTTSWALPGIVYNIRCWKWTGATVDLVSSGGHSADFDGRRVFPIPFLLRHYPIRGQTHGTRKVFEDRLPRFDRAERDRGWHVQYDGLDAQHAFVRPVGELSPYDPDAVRVDSHLGPTVALDNRVTELERQVVDLTQESAERSREVNGLSQHVAGLTAQLDQQRQRAEALQEALDARTAELAVNARPCAIRPISWL